MKKKFKYAIKYKPTSKEEAEELVSELVTLGYNITKYTKYDNRDSVCTNVDNISNKIDYLTYESYNRELIDSKELFLALAAQVDSEEFYEGEYIMCIRTYTGQYTEGNVYQVRSTSNHGKGVTTVVDDTDSDTNGFADCNKWFRKATKEEIEVCINSQKKVETIKEEKQMKEQFTVEGSAALKKALVEELQEKGLDESSIAYTNYLIPSGFKNNSITSRGAKCNIHYKLPEQYNEAKQAFIDYFKEELVVGKWYKNGNGKTMFVYGDDNRYGFDSNGIWSSLIGKAFDNRLVLATSEEVEQALITEAKKKGYEGKYIKIMLDSRVGEKSHAVMSGELEYTKSTDQLRFNSGSSIYTIYCNGKWAEILPSTPNIVINGYTAKFEERFVKFGCQNIPLAKIQGIYNVMEDWNDSMSYSMNNIDFDRFTVTFLQLKEIVEYYKNK